MIKNKIPWFAAAVLLILSCACTAETAQTTPVPEPSATGEEVITPAAATAERPNSAAETPAMETVTRALDPDSLFPEEEGLDVELIVPQDPAAKGRIATAKNDLATLLEVDAADIEVTAYEAVVWRDGSLGCPQPDMMYTQALVDGYVIQLSVDGQLYNYHGADGRDPFLCTNSLDQPNALPGPERGGFLDESTSE